MIYLLDTHALIWWVSNNPKLSAQSYQTIANTIQTLPPIHRDPFDWMLIAQCIVEDYTYITKDNYIKQYDIPILSA